MADATVMVVVGGLVEMGSSDQAEEGECRWRAQVK